MSPIDWLGLLYGGTEPPWWLQWFAPTVLSVGHLCQPVTLKDGVSPVTVLSWHSLACSVGHFCKPLTLEGALGPL